MRTSQLGKRKQSVAPRTYFGQELASPVIAWLNAASKTPSAAASLRRIEKLIALLLNSEEADDRFRKSDWTDGSALNTLGVAQSNICVLLEEYSMLMPSVERVGSEYRLRFIDRNEDHFGVDLDEGAPGIHRWIWEIQVVLNLFALAENAILSRVTRCEMCHTWRFGKFSHQKWCSPECSQAYRKSDIAKKARNARLAKARAIGKGKDRIIKQLIGFKGHGSRAKASTRRSR